MIIDYSFKKFKKSKSLCTEFDPWNIAESTYRPEDNVRYESIFSQGNGYMGGRGFTEEGYSGDFKNTLKCIFVAGVYDNFKGRFVEIVNVPNFFKTDIHLGGEKFDPLKMRVVNYQRNLNMKNGLLTRELEVVQKNGNRTRLCFKRFYSVANTHIAGSRIEITPLNYSGPIKIESFIDGDVANIKQGFWPPLKETEYNYHLDIVDKSFPQKNTMVLSTRTKTTKIDISIASSIKLNLECEPETINNEKSIGYSYQINGQKNKTVTIDKIISVFTSRDKVKKTVQAQALDTLKIESKSGFKGALRETEKAWQEKWATQDIKIEGNVKDQQAIRFNIFNLIQANKSDDPTVNIGAKCLTHMRYNGYFFWD
ncbi:MAG TPA: hypothetical protein PK821_01600, partial [Victivallales bacterium]|nr:hypothetical protein [Victivallales bacterium]